MGHSQSENTVNSVDSTEIKIPTPIPPTELVERMENVANKIKTAKKKIEPGARVQEIDSLYPLTSEFILEQRDKARLFLKANPNKQKIENLMKKWNGYLDQVNSWEVTINDFLQKNTLQLEVVSFEEKVWNLTHQNALSLKLPYDVIASVKSTWNGVKKVQQEIVKSNNEYLSLSSKLNKQKAVIIETIDQLDAFKRSDVYDITYLRHPPLWKTDFNDSSEKENDQSGVESIKNNLTSTKKYIQNNESTFYLFFILILLIIGVFILLKRSFIKYDFNEEDADLQKAKDVILNRNVVSMVFISLIIALEFFNNTPMLIFDLLSLLTIIAAIPVVQPYMYKRFKKIIYFVPLFFVLDTLKTYVWFSSSQYRIYLLFEALLVIAILFSFTRPYLQTRKMKMGFFGILLVRFTPVVYLLALISIVSNILGYTNLTDITLKICTQSSVITLVFYGILMISGGVSIGFLHRYFYGREYFDKDYKLKVEIRVLQIIRAVVFILWFVFFLVMIDLWGPLATWADEFFTQIHKMGNTTFTYGSIGLFLLVLTVSFIVTSIISTVIDAGALNFLRLPKGIPAAISLVIRYFIIAFGFVLALSALGIDLSKFNLMAGALGLGIGFGLQTIISNFVSGVILVFERPILAGDTVEVNNLLGTVSRIGVRASNIRTFDGAEVVVPNNNLISNDLINWTLSDNVKRVEIIIGAAYGSDPNQVLKIMEKEGAKCEHALLDPPPRALFTNFGDSSLNFRLLFWVPYTEGLGAKSEVSIGIYNAFKENGIEIPFPQQDVYIKEKPEESAQLEGYIKTKPQAKKKPIIAKDKDSEEDETI